MRVVITHEAGTGNKARNLPLAEAFAGYGHLSPRA